MITRNFGKKNVAVIAKITERNGRPNSPWLTIGKDIYHASCKICDKSIMAQLGILQKHGASDSHKKMVNIVRLQANLLHE